MYIRRSSLWRIAIFFFATLACAVTFAVINHIRIKEYTIAANVSDRRSFAQLCEAVSSIDSELSRSYFATGSPSQLFRISNEISKHTEAAKTALAALPSRPRWKSRRGKGLPDRDAQARKCPSGR